jgi:hypothetical protein
MIKKNNVMKCIFLKKNCNVMTCNVCILLSVYVYIYIIAMLLPTNPHLVGGCNPSEKYESQMGLLFPIHGKS